MLLLFINYKGVKVKIAQNQREPKTRNVGHYLAIFEYTRSRIKY